MPYFLANAGRALAGLQVEKKIPRTAATYKRVFTGRLAIRLTPIPPQTSILPPQLRCAKRLVDNAIGSRSVWVKGIWKECFRQNSSLALPQRQLPHSADTLQTNFRKPRVASPSRERRATFSP